MNTLLVTVTKDTITTTADYDLTTIYDNDVSTDTTSIIQLWKIRRIASGKIKNMSKVDEIGREGNVPEKNQLFNLSYVGNFRIKNHETLQLFHSRTKTSELVTSQALLNQYSGVSVATRPLFAEQMFASDRAPV